MLPNLFHIGAFTVHAYGLFLALGFLTGMGVAAHYGRKEGIPASRMLDLILYAFLAALAGAKILHIFVDYSYYSQDWSRLSRLYQVGGVYYGGLILAVLVSALYMRLKKMNFWKTADAMCMGLAAGQILGRLGCFFAGCCWGRECYPGFPLGVVFRNPDAAAQVGTPLFVQLHPAQLYEASGLILILCLLALLYSRKRFDGQQMFLYLSLYSLLRFFDEFFRGDPRGTVLGGILSTSQFISLLILPAVAVAWWFRRRQLKMIRPVLS